VSGVSQFRRRKGARRLGASNVLNLWKSPQDVDAYVAANPSLSVIADKPHAKWAGDWISTANITSTIAGYATAATGRVMVLVMYGIPGRDLGGYSSGGFPDRASYLAWVQAYVNGIGSAPSFLVYEPDALGHLGSMTDAARAERIETMRQASVILATTQNTESFIDVGMWMDPAVAADYLVQVGVANVSGFALNVSAFERQADCYAKGDAIVAQLATRGVQGSKYIVDSSRNGNGPLTSAFGSAAQPWLDANQPWCNPPGRALGLAPGLVAGRPSCRATLWIKNPGGSDGDSPRTAAATGKFVSNYYGENAPAAGTFWLKWALDCVAYSNGGTTTTTQPRLTKTATGMIQKAGANWRTGGFNAFQLATNDYPSPRIMSHAEIDSLLDKAVTMKAYFLRAHTLGISIGDQPYHLVAGVTGTTTPVITYRPAVWEAIDYAIAGAAARGVYLMVPMTDELGYYHGGKRQWVNARRPGTCSTDYNVKSANSSTERAAESYFYSDPQIKADFKQYIKDWLNHVNRYTGRANKDEPAVAIIETGNELWTSVQDAPGWCVEICQHIESVAPLVLTADGGGTDGQSLNQTSLASSAVDVFSTHPYSTYGPNDVTSQAIQAATAGKAYLVGEYPWSKAAAPSVEAAVRAAGNCFTSAPWSLQNDADLHNNGAAYGTDDVSFYVPGKDATQVAAVARLQAHAQAMADSAATATPAQQPPDTTQAGLSDDFTGNNGAAPDTSKWNVYPSNGSTATIQSNALRLVTGPLGKYQDKIAVTSKASARLNQRVTLDFTPTALNEAYFQVVLRSAAADNSIGDVTSYRLEVSVGNGAYALVRRGASPVTIGTGNIAGWGAGVTAHIDFAVIGSTQVVYLWTGTTKPSTPTISGANTEITTAGYNGFILNGGDAAVTATMTVDNYVLSNAATGNLFPAPMADMEGSDLSVYGTHGTGATLSYDTSWVNTGSQSLRITAGSGASTDAGASFTIPGGVTAGTNIAFQVAVRRGSGTTAAQVTVKWRSSTALLAEVTLGTVTTTVGGVSVITSTQTVPTGATIGAVVVRWMTAVPAAGSYLQVDTLSAALTAVNPNTGQPGGTVAPRATTDAYTISGTQLRKGGQPFKVIGANIGVNAAIGGNYTSDESVSAHTAEAIQWGWNSVRMTVYVSTITSWIASMGRQNAINQIFSATDKYLAAGFVVVLAVMDQTSGLQAESEQAKLDFEDFFSQAGTRYKNDSRVWFNVNEPTGVYNVTTFMALNSRMYSAVRNTGNNGIYVADILVNAQDARYSPNTTRAWDPTLGPAFLANSGGTPRANVLFGLHNYGGMVENNWGQTLANTTYNDWADKMTAAGLAFFTGETGYKQNGLDQAGNTTDYPRNRMGFYAALQQKATNGTLVWDGTFDQFTLKAEMQTQYHGQPFWYQGAGTNLSEMGLAFWNYGHSYTL
jgi:endoglucanase